MCGICGIFGHPTPELHDVLRMTELLSHRGPDGRGLWQGEFSTLGFRRLQIFGGKNGRQPILNETAKIAMICNGEIYNYRTLRAELISRGHVFLTTSDTEVIVHLFEDYGPDAWNQLNGDSAIAIVDERVSPGILYLARDRLGVKPLYWSITDQQLVFSSEIAPLLHVRPELRQINLEAIFHYFTFRFVPGTQTAFRSVYRLEPGCFLQYSDGRAHVKSYWDLQNTVENDSQCSLEIISDLQTQIENAIRLQSYADVPKGVALSGGVDSSMVLTLLRRFSESPIRAYTVNFPGVRYDYGEETELPWAQLIGSSTGVDVTAVNVSCDLFREAAPETIRRLEEPIADAAAVPLFLLSKRASEDIRVVYSGDGADEIFAGYGVYEELLERNVPYTTVCMVYGDPMKRRLLNPELFDQYEVQASEQLATAAGRPFASRDLLTQMLYIDSKLWLPDDLLLKTDKIHMSWGIEARVPFLDRVLVEKVFSLSGKYKSGKWYDKRLLRECAKQILPIPIAERPKKGFPLPLDQWLRGSLSTWLHELLLSKERHIDRFVCEQNFSTYIEEYLQGLTSPSEAHRIWAFITLELWLREYFEH